MDRPLRITTFRFTLALALLSGCLDVPELAAGVVVRCSVSADCGSGAVCVGAEGVCVDALDPCVVVDDAGAAVRAVDGAACAGGICVDSVCQAPRCGDGIVTRSDDPARDERCDSTPGCRPSCTACGDGVIDGDDGEECDDAALNSDTRANACRSTCENRRCGDGVIDDGEACDDGPDNDDDADCRADCTACGDGFVDVEHGEDCDDGDRNSDTAENACRSDCSAHRCGDGVIDDGEGCDDGARNDDALADACRTSCVRAACGDGIVDDGEACDDDNNDDGDGCRGDCSKTEACGDAVVDVGEACDDGDDNPRDGCDACRVQTFVDELLLSGALTSDSFPYVFARPGPVAFDGAGRLFVADVLGHRVVRVEREDDGSETVVPVAGTGAAGFSGDGGLATAAELNAPFGLAFDERRQRLYISDANNHRVRVVDRDGVITTFAGNGSDRVPVVPEVEPAGDATAAALVFPSSLALDAAGNVLIAEQGGGRLRRVRLGNSETPPQIETLAGGAIPVEERRFAGGECRAAVPVACAPACNFGETCLPSGFCGLLANSAEDCPNRTFVPTPPRAGEAGIRAADVRLGVPTSVIVDDNLGVVFTDFTNHVVYRIDDHGFIETLLGTRRVNAGFAGDGGPGVRARISGPAGIAIVDDVLYVAEQGNHVVRALDLQTRLVTTHTGTLPTPEPRTAENECTPLFDDEFLVGRGGRSCAVGHPGNTETALSEPTALAVSPQGELVVSEIGNATVRTIDVDGRVRPTFGVGRSLAVTQTVATVFEGFISPGAMAVDGAGRVYVADPGSIPIIRAGPGPSLITPSQPVLHPQIVRLEPDGTVVRVAGTADAGTAGDGGQATLAQLTDPRALAFDADGVLFVLDGARLRRITPDGRIDTLTTPLGVFSMGSANGRIVAVAEDQRSVVAIDGDDASVIATSPLPADIAGLFDIWPADDGSVYIAGATALDDNFIDFSLDLFHLEGDALVPVSFAQGEIAPLFSARFTLAAVVETQPLAVVVVDHDAAVVRRLFADGDAALVAGDPAGREACVPRARASTCKRLVDNVGPALFDTLGDDDLVASPAGDRSTLRTPLRLVQRANLFFPGIDDLEPDTPAPRFAAVQRALANSRLAFAHDGALLLSEQPVTALEIRSTTELPSPLGQQAGRIRRIDVATDTLLTLAGPVHPPGVGPAAFPTRLYSPRAIAVVDDDIFAVGDFGRVVRATFAADALQSLDVVVGIASDLGAPVGTLGTDVPALVEIGGLALSDTHAVVAGTAATGPTVIVFAAADITDAATWSVARVFSGSGLVSPAGVSFDRAGDRFLVVDEADACVRAVDVDLGIAADAVAGVCGQAGDAPGFLDAPRAAVAAGPDIFVSDTGNHRVERYSSPESAITVVGDGSDSVAGDGAPARTFALSAPEQLAFDDFGNLYITSSSVVRLVSDVLDDDPDNDTVFTIFGRDRRAFPASAAFCLSGLSTFSDGEDGGVVVVDACQSFAVRLRSVTP